MLLINAVKNSCVRDWLQKNVFSVHGVKISAQPQRSKWLLPKIYKDVEKPVNESTL